MLPFILELRQQKIALVNFTLNEYMMMMNRITAASGELRGWTCAPPLCPYMSVNTLYGLVNR